LTRRIPPGRLLNRALAAALALLVLAQSPASAMSTAAEIAAGTKENQEIDAQSVVIHDPFLSDWVNRIGTNLLQHRKRRDITYRFTIIDDKSINAFAIKGGYVHVNVGLLNFVDADDDLGATLGHEMGHVELRHVVKEDNTDTIIGILESLLSIISIPTAILGGVGGELATERYSRGDELAADKYGLGLMAEAGYDPHAAVDVMRKLGTTDPGPETRVEKAFIDHPIPADRVAHLLGYPQLDDLPPDVIVEHAMHDVSEGRYSYAQAELRGVASADASIVPASDLDQLGYALRESGPLAAPDSRAYAPPIPDFEARRAEALAALGRANQEQLAAFAAAKTDANLGELELGDAENRLEASPEVAAAVQDTIPPPPPPPQHATPQPSAQPTADPSGPVTAPVRAASPPPGPPPQTAELLERNLDEIANLTDDVFSSAPGLLQDEQSTIEDLASPLEEPGPLTPKYAALFQYYPGMTQDLRSATAGLTDSIAKARSSIAQVNQALILFQGTLSTIPPQAQNGGPPDPRMMQRIRSATSEFSSDIAGALQDAQQGSSEMYAGQAASLSTQISTLDLYSSPERYEAFRKALAFRFPGIVAPEYSQVGSLGVPAGELGCDAWLAFETGRPIAAVIAPMTAAGSPCIAAMMSSHQFAESLEIAEGLLFEDYDETPSTG
jgi:Zn-dependent protease with chaperone function